MADEVTPDGYRIIPPLTETLERGIQCGQCGLRFDNGKAYGYACPSGRCPVFGAPSVLLALGPTERYGYRTLPACNSDFDKGDA
jgi:hypothetical protein